MWEPKLCAGLLVTGETRAGLGAGIDNEHALAAPGLDVFTARTVTRLTSRFAFHGVIGHVEATVRTARKGADDIGVALVARSVADERRARDLWCVRELDRARLTGR